MDSAKLLMHDGDVLAATDVPPLSGRAVRGGRLRANDVKLDGRRDQLIILTGPNMGGKSTFLRQAALRV